MKVEKKSLKEQPMRGVSLQTSVNGVNSMSELYGITKSQAERTGSVGNGGASVGGISGRGGAVGNVVHKGPKEFWHLVTPEVTPEVKRELEILSMRGFWDTKSFFKVDSLFLLFILICRVIVKSVNYQKSLR